MHASMLKASWCTFELRFFVNIWLGLLNLSVDTLKDAVARRARQRLQGVAQATCI